MKKFDAATIKKHAIQCGADVVGIGNIERYEGAPMAFDPRYIMPEAKSVVVLGFRIFRGLLRGIEEGTAFAPYASMGYAAQNQVRMPVVMWNFGRIFEDNGYEAMLIHQDQAWSAYDQHMGVFKRNYSRPVAPGRPAPDVWLNVRIAAYIAGLGEIGWSQMFLSAKFGPRCRFCIILTEAELEPDPLVEPGTLCDRCMACVKMCGPGAISRTESVKVTVAGKQLEWGKLDLVKCLAGLEAEDAPDEALEKGSADPDIWNASRREIRKPNQFNPFQAKVPPLYNYGRGIEGGRGCIRACMIHLEQQGKLENQFHQQFRRRSEWKLTPWDHDDTGVCSSQFGCNTKPE